MQEEYDEYHPRYYLNKYKITTTASPCRICGRSAYYSHPDLGNLCLSHFLDLLNIGEMKWKWADHEDIWNLTESLLKRTSTFARTMAALSRGYVNVEPPLDGLKHCYKCNTNKHVSQFSKNRYKLDGLQNHCRVCHNDYRRQHRGRRNRGR